MADVKEDWWFIEGHEGLRGAWYAALEDAFVAGYADHSWTGNGNAKYLEPQFYWQSGEEVELGERRHRRVNCREIWLLEFSYFDA